MLNKNFILHLSLIEGIGPITVQTIIDKKSDAPISDLYHFSVSDWIHYYGLKETAAQKIVAGLSDKKILETELHLIEKYQIQWVTILDDAYPALLRTIYMPPTVIYFKGGNFDNNKKHIAVVGSRDSNSYGFKVLTMIIPELIAGDITIVSGGARGIDTLAHECAINYGGKTIAVLGSGLLKEYPVSNKKLFKSIIDNNGLVISIFPLQMEPLPGNFPARNRVIAGLSHGCLVIQAAQKSGALITAHYALEQGREIFAIPSMIDDPLSVGCHTLIQQGAKLVTCGKDILQEIGCDYPIKRDIQITLCNETKQVVEQSMLNLSQVQKKIIVVCKKASSLDDIVQETSLELSVVQSTLFMMQLEGFVEQDFTGKWMTTRFF